MHPFKILNFVFAPKQVSGDPDEQLEEQEVCICIPLSRSFAHGLRLLVEEVCPFFISHQDLLHLKVCRLSLQCCGSGMFKSGAMDPNFSIPDPDPHQRI